MYIYDGGVANSTTIHNGGYMNISSGGTATFVTVCDYANLTVFSGGVVSGVTGAFKVYSGAVVNGVQCDREFLVGEKFNSSGVLSGMYGMSLLNAEVLSGASVFYGTMNSYWENTIIRSGGVMDFEYCENSSTCFNQLTVENGGEFIMDAVGATVSRGLINGVLAVDKASLSEATVNSGGIIYLTNRAKGSDITVGNAGNLYVAMTGSAQNITIDGGNVHVATGGRVSDVTISSNGRLYLYGGAILDGEINVSGTMILDDDTVNNGNVNLVLSESTSSPMISHMSRLLGGTCSVTVGSAGEGEYLLAQDAGSFTGSIDIRDSSGELARSLQAGEFVTIDETIYRLQQNDDMLSLETIIQNCKKSINWSESATDEYIVELSRDNFVNVLRLTVNSTTLDNYLPVSGTYQWRVSLDGQNWITGDNIQADLPAAPENIFSDADGDMDVFFANANGVWETGYAAEHQGSGSWQGTKEQIILDGKNKIADVFTGSTDANVLVLTDDTNGDALFIDDIFTQFGSDASRLAQIDEIRAGAGDDIVDLTSQQFAYVGNGVKVYGGSGDDTIWANSGNNTLFGDAGNDRLVGANGDDIIIGGAGNDSMHGGGGNDIFCFGAHFGNDTVEQLAGGSVTLHFETGSEANWNADTLTYTDGENSVKVSGVSDVTLVFGEPAPVEGAFLDAASEKIFEDKSKGMIA